MKNKKPLLAGLALGILTFAPVTAYAAGPDWTGSYGQTRSGIAVQQTYDFGATGNGQGSNGSNSSSSPDGGGNHGTTPGTPGGGGDPGSVSYYHTYTSQDAANDGLITGIDAAGTTSSGSTSGYFAPTQQVYDNVHHLIGPPVPTYGPQAPGQYQTSWNSTTSGETLFNYTPLYWDWSFTNSDFPSANYTVNRGPLQSIHAHFAKSGYWHVNYNEFGTYTWGHYEYRTITVQSTYNGKSSSTTHTITIPHIDSVESHYKGWAHLTDFRLSDWDINGGGTNGGGGCVGGCTVPGPMTQQVQLDTTTSQVVAK